MNRFVAVGALLFVWACSSSSSNGAGDGGATACTANQQVACACGGGKAGAQACRGDGSGYLPCDCGDVGSPTLDGGGGARDASATTDGSADDASRADGASPKDASGDAPFDAGYCGFNLDPSDTLDHDSDGVSVAAGDCNDCDPSIHPGAGCP